ncbi:MAG: hypothetical protein GJ676_15370 [Rhodobacteraceae bacterium]|nr:hypothetical protein [Paracoccaceae bacterium]
MRKTIKDLLLALLNATLILVALCLFFAWQLSATASEIATNFAKSLVPLAPLRADVQGLSDELKSLRAELSGLGDKVGEEASADLYVLRSRIEAYDLKISELKTRFAELDEVPDQLIDKAIEQSVDRVAMRMIEFRGCVPQDPADLK